MENPRRYGEPPFSVALVHGGPGAAGDLASLARELAGDLGVLEPLQTKTSVDGQVRELTELVRAHGRTPVVLIGHSWGAWLVLLAAAKHPDLASKVVLVGSGPFEASWTSEIGAARRARIAREEREEYDRLLARLDSLSDADLARLGSLASRADDYDPLPREGGDEVAVDGAIFAKVWPEAAALRESGELLRRAALVRVPVVAIHGEEDPHPASGVEEPLRRTLGDFRMIRLPRCGHSPWRERFARDELLRRLRREISSRG